MEEEWLDKVEESKMLKAIKVAHAPTKAEGLKMLAEYNDSPYDPEANKLTFAEVYKLWSDVDKFICMTTNCGFSSDM